MGKITGMDLSQDEIPELKGFDSFELKLGDELRGERATRGKSLLDVQREIRIKAAYISAIENCDISVFPNAGFVAGYVRSYARYLKLDPEETYRRFCEEARFEGTNPELARTTARPKAAPVVAEKAGTDSWAKKMPGFQAPKPGAARHLAALGPLTVLVAVVLGIGYGGLSVLKDIQRVEFAPIEQEPVVAGLGPELVGEAGTAGFGDSEEVALAANAASLYEKIELEIPVVEPRDGPIFAIATNEPPAMTETGEMLTADEILIPEAVLVATADTPVVSQTPHIPDVTVVATEEAWVRLYYPDGTIVFEKILAAGEQYALEESSENLLLRAGNATAVYVMVDDKPYGPLSGSGAVVKNVSVQPDQLVASYTAVGDASGSLKLAAEEWRRTNTARLSE